MSGKSINILQRDISAAPFYYRFHYWSIFGKLNFSKNITQCDISYATYQVSRFYEDPCRTHSAAVEYLAGYLRGTRDDGFILNTNHVKSFKVYPDTEICGNWYRPTTINDPLTKKSQSGYILLYTVGPTVWASKVQTVIYLTSTEAEYVSLSQSLSILIPLIGIIREMKIFAFEVFLKEPIVYCKALKDNVEMVNLVSHLNR